MTHRVWPGVLTAVVMSGFMAGATAQERFQPRGPDVAPATYLHIDDEDLDVTGLEVSVDSDNLFRIRPQGAPVDSNSLNWNQKYNGWEAGVMPIEFAPDITQAHRDQFLRVCNQGWGSAALVLCIVRTSQNGYLHVTQLDDEGTASPCHSSLGQARRLVVYQLNLGTTCWSDATIYHEMGHAFGFWHEQQRPDRDTYLFIDTANVRPDAIGNFTKANLSDALGPYDFLSIMHYRSNAFAIDTTKPTMIPRSGYTSFANSMGTSSVPTANDRAAIANLYNHYLSRSLPVVFPTPTTRFDRTDFLDAMERLHAFYFSRMGLGRPNGLSIDGKPDFQGIATWIFDLYLGARSAGISAEESFGIVVVDITQSAEWKSKHPGGTSGTRGSFTPAVRLDRNEFLDALQKLDRFYSAPEGLQRPNGLSISGGPDFLGIATWIFDVYLNERLRGGSATLAWQQVVNAIQATPEWRSKH